MDEEDAPYRRRTAERPPPSAWDWKPWSVKPLINAYGRSVVRSPTLRMSSDAGRSRRRPTGIIESGRMILVDTSVWIRFFSNQAPYADDPIRFLIAARWLVTNWSTENF
jgi:hypothetical protein